MVLFSTVLMELRATILSQGPPVSFAQRRAYWIPGYRFRPHYTRELSVNADMFACKIRGWANRLGPQNLRLLVHVAVSFSDPEFSAFKIEARLDRRFSKCSGLSISGFADSEVATLQDALSVLEPCIESVEKDRILFGLRGEAIVLALTTQAPTWLAAYRQWFRAIDWAKRERE